MDRESLLRRGSRRYAACDRAFAVDLEMARNDMTVHIPGTWISEPDWGSGTFHFSSRPEIAQVLCAGPIRSATIRRGDRVTVVGQAGVTRIQKIEDVPLTPVAMSIYLRGGDAKGELTPVVIFARVAELPSVEEARKVHERIAKEAGVEVRLVLRTDAFFPMSGGPNWDSFAPDLPRGGTAEAFVRRPRVSCFGEKPKSVCKLYDGK